MQFQTLRIFERARHHIPLIKFPNRHGVQVNHAVNINTTTTPTNKSNKNHTYLPEAPYKRLKMKTEEIDLISLGGAIDIAPPPKPKSKK